MNRKVSWSVAFPSPYYLVVATAAGVPYWRVILRFGAGMRGISIW
jgi:hypothetical protein